MKKEVLLFLLFFLCLQCFSMKVSAEEQPTLPYYVSDVAGLLTEEQRTFLEETATRVSEKYACGVYLVTLPDYREYDSSARNYWDFSQSFYKRYNLGIGEEKNGILLIMSLEERDYSILAYGSRAHYAFTDYGRKYLRALSWMISEAMTGMVAFKTISGAVRIFCSGQKTGIPLTLSFMRVLNKQNSVRKHGC